MTLRFWRPSGATLTRLHFRSIQRVQATSVRIDTTTYGELKRLAADLGTTVGETVTIAVRRLRQDQIGKQLATPLTTAEVEWLDAELS